MHLTIEDVENALCDPVSHGVSRSSGHPILWGQAIDGRLIVVVYEEIDKFTIPLLENGHGNPTMTTLRRVADAIGVEILVTVQATSR